MCGICGIISKGGNTEVDKDLVRKMNIEMVHRGPDSDGFFNDKNVSMGIRRLSIIDLDGGNQPLYNEDGSIILVANGEIYNFIELREILTQKEHSFRTKSDCETIIHAYEEYGDRFLEYLRGMFSFCLYDSSKKIVWLVRDRLGEKPLYLSKQSSRIIFSSELKSLIRAIPPKNFLLNKKSLYSYFHYGYIPGNETMIESVIKLPPGYIFRWSLEETEGKTIKYWDIKKSPEIKTDPAKEIRRQIEEIEKIIVRSDVPVGVSLSGGIDSSLIAILAAKSSKKCLHAFSVGYPGYPENDERKMAESLAKKLGMKFHNVEISEKDFAEEFEKIVESMDDPIADIAAYGYYSVSKEARKNNVPVLLAGFGADELFWGYEWVREAVKYNTLKKKTWGKFFVFALLIKRFWRQVLKTPIPMLKLILDLSFSSRQIFYELTPTWIYMKRYKKHIFGPKFVSALKLDSIPLRTKDWPAVYENSEIGATVLLKNIWLVSNCLDLGDRMSMANSIEMRLPFVDYKLFETVVGLRKKKKDSGLGYKKWFIDSVKDILPKEIYLRKKRGFTPPTRLWIHNILKKHEDLLLDGYLINKGVVNKKYMNLVLKNIDRHVKFLYMALVFEVWVKKYLQ